MVDLNMRVSARATRRIIEPAPPGFSSVNMSQIPQSESEALVVTYGGTKRPELHKWVGFADEHDSRATIGLEPDPLAYGHILGF